MSIRLNILTFGADVEWPSYVATFSNDGKSLFVAYGPILTMWDIATRDRRLKIRARSRLNWFSALAVSQESNLIFAGGSTLTVWDMKSGSLVDEVQAESRIISLAVDASGECLFIGEINGVVHALRVSDWVELERRTVAPPATVALDSKAHVAAIGSGEGIVRLVDPLSMMSRGRALQ